MWGITAILRLWLYCRKCVLSLFTIYSSHFSQLTNNLSILGHIRTPPLDVMCRNNFHGTQLEFQPVYILITLDKTQCILTNLSDCRKQLTLLPFNAHGVGHPPYFCGAGIPWTAVRWPGRSRTQNAPPGKKKITVVT